MLKDFAKVFSGRMGQTLIGFVTLFVLLRLMTKVDYGLLALVTSISGVIAVVAQFGLSSGLSKLINDAQVKAPETVVVLFRRGLVIQFVLLAVIGLAGTGIAATIYADELGLRLPILAGIALFVVGTVSGEHYFRTGRTLNLFGSIARLTLWMAAARFVGAVIPYWLTGSIAWSVFGYGALQAATAGIYLYRLTRVIGEGEEVSVALAGGLGVREYVHVALPFLVIASSNIIFSQIALLVLGKAHTLESVAEYEVANRVVNILRSPAIAFSFVISSRFGRAVASDDVEAVTQRLRTNAQVSLLGVPLAAALFFSSEWVLVVLAGEAYADAILLVQILCVYLAGAFVADSYSLSIDYSGLSRARAWIVVAVAALNVTLSALFIPSLGAIGAALATCVATVIQAVCFIYLIRREFSVTFIDAVGIRSATGAAALIVMMTGLIMAGNSVDIPVAARVAGFIGSVGIGIVLASRLVPQRAATV